MPAPRCGRKSIAGCSTAAPQKQDTRIRILLEQDAFNRIYENWRAVGFPFGHLVPSLGTAIGASGDRPEALAELMGIILNDGVRVPTASIERLRFANNTPYETNLVARGPARARDAGRGRADCAAGADRGRHERHSAPAQRHLYRGQRHPAGGRRQDRHRRQPLSSAIRPAAG